MAKLKKIESCTYAITGTPFVVEQMEKGWDAYEPHYTDRLWRLWQTVGWRTRRDAIRSAMMEHRIRRMRNG